MDSYNVRMHSIYVTNWRVDPGESYNKYQLMGRAQSVLEGAIVEIIDSTQPDGREHQRHRAEVRNLDHLWLAIGTHNVL